MEGSLAGAPQRRSTSWTALPVAATVALAVALVMIFAYAPREATMGDVQRIFYLHVAAAWVGFLGFLVTAVAGAFYLAWGRAAADHLARASAEVGLALMVVAVVSGALWARPVWGVYWTWEPRLTISAVQLTIYLAYTMLRGLAQGDAARAARLAAVYGIAAGVTVPLSWFAIRWWRTIHPVIVGAGGEMALTPRMVQTLLVSMVAFTLLYAALTRARMRLAADEACLTRLRARLLAEE